MFKKKDKEAVANDPFADMPFEIFVKYRLDHIKYNLFLVSKSICANIVAQKEPNLTYEEIVEKANKLSIELSKVSEN